MLVYRPRRTGRGAGGGGLEVRFTLEFHCLCLAERRQAAISSARLGEERAKPDGTQPSVVLRMAAPGERLWDIAKAYGTTTEEITQANELEEGCLPTGQDAPDPPGTLISSARSRTGLSACGPAPFSNKGWKSYAARSYSTAYPHTL